MGWKEEYIKCLTCIDPNDLKIEEAHSIKQANMPKYLYKYRPPTKHALVNLMSNTVWLNSPSKYNDPFECVEYTDYGKVASTINDRNVETAISDLCEGKDVPAAIIGKAKKTKNPVEIIGSYLLEKEEGFTPEKIKVFNQILVDTAKKQYDQMSTSKNVFMQETMKICSFCESFEPILMWSHYAEFHKGFCIEYDLSKWDSNDVRRRLLHPVIYQEDLFDATEHMVQGVKHKKFNVLYPLISCSTKSKKWEYEKEWRMIFNIGPSFKEQIYSMDCQSKIFIGCRMEKGFKDELIAICKRMNIEFLEAKASLHKYELDFVPIPIKK